MRKKQKWMVPVVLSFKMSFGSVVLGGMMEPIDVRKEFLSRSYIKNEQLENHGKACEDTKLYAHESIKFAI